MNGITPEQMRALANDANWRSQKLDHAEDRRAIHKYEAALRTAADQLEAVQAIVQRLSHATPRRLLEEALSLTADTAPGA